VSRFILLVRLSVVIMIVGLGVAVSAQADGGPPPPSPSRATTVPSCTIGETHAPTTTVNQFDLTSLSVYQLVDPAECASCAGASIQIDQVSWRFKYYTTQCPLTFEIAVVASDGGTCPRPDTTQVLCGPFVYVYTSTGVASPTVTIPFPTSCCIPGRAFVRWRTLDTGGCPVGLLAFFAYAPGFDILCRSYVSFPDAPLEDSTTELGLYPTITAGASCCGSTPTKRQSWGKMKLIYR
jgi:hypothetical protein